MRTRSLILSTLILGILFSLPTSELWAGPRKGPVEVSVQSQFETSNPGGFNELAYTVENRSKNKVIEVTVRAYVVYADGTEDVVSEPVLQLDPGQAFGIFLLHIVPEGTAEGTAFHVVEAAAEVIDGAGSSRKGPPFAVEDQDSFEVVE